MIATNPIQAANPAPFVLSEQRRAAQSETPTVFGDIYQADTNIVIWQRELPASLQAEVKAFLIEKPTFQNAMIISPENTLTNLSETFGTTAYAELSANIAELVEMFCDLFELKHVGLRMTALHRAMCPKFHTDNVPCRLITTYQGEATEWLPHSLVNRSKLGAGSKGLPDHESGLFQNLEDIQQLRSGDVALLKGERWEGNENAGLVHRSPALDAGESRLLLTLDFSD